MGYESKYKGSEVEVILDKVSTDRQFYVNELLTLRSDLEVWDKGYGNFVAQHEELYDVNGKLLRDINGQTLTARVPSQEYASFVKIAKDYENEVQAVILSEGVVEPTEAFLSARVNYNKARVELQKTISDGTKESVEAVGQGVDDLKYLSQVFGEDKNNYSDGAVLSRLLGVKNGDADNPDTVAGLYGGGVDALDDIGFKNADGQTLMMFAGAEGIRGAENARFRVYDDGTLHANKGVFSGIITKSPTTITPDNIGKYASVISETITGDSGNILQITNLLDLTKIGSYIIFDYPSPPLKVGKTVIDLPYYAESNIGMSSRYELEDVIPLIGVNILVQFNESSGIDCFGVVVISDTGGVGGQCYQAKNGALFSLTCDAVTYNGEFNIGWKVKIIR